MDNYRSRYEEWLGCGAESRAGAGVKSGLDSGSGDHSCTETGFDCGSGCEAGSGSGFVVGGWNASFINELRSIQENDAEIRDRFYRDLAFGTGGMRGVIGAGTNRMNLCTVARATRGLADYILSGADAEVFVCEDGTDVREKQGVVIAYDSRRMSPEFARCAADCLCDAGIPVYLFESLRPTPELSFAVRELGCRAGIVITASHNPPEYNGYKVYWADGGQITDQLAEGITAAIEKLPYGSGLDGGVGAGVDSGAGIAADFGAGAGTVPAPLHIIGKEMDDRYIAALRALILRPEALKAAAGELRIVYTPLHGSGNLPVQRVLRELGFSRVWAVPEQELPDGDFPTVTYPNPEDAAAFELALALAKQVDADLVLATDPDADRLGIYAKDTATGNYIPFSGNMSGMLMAEYRLSALQEQGHSFENSALVSTIVSTKMARAVGAAYGAAVIETLTGFKYIGEQIRFFETRRAGGQYDRSAGAYEFLFGFEESYGCLPGIHARDKDAVAAVMCLCEAAAYYRTRGMTLCDQMEAMYKKYGYYRESLISVTLPGADGAEKIQRYMEEKRLQPPRSFGGLAVTDFRDYRAQPFVYENCARPVSCRAAANPEGPDQEGLPAGKRSLEGASIYEPPLEMPRSNVLYFELEQDAWVCMRPSGTEPKIKFYIGVRGETGQEADALSAALRAEFEGEMGI